MTIDLTKLKNSDLAIQAIEWMKFYNVVEESATYQMTEIVNDAGDCTVLIVHKYLGIVDYDYLKNNQLPDARYFTNSLDYFESFKNHFGIQDEAIMLPKGAMMEGE